MPPAFEVNSDQDRLLYAVATVIAFRCWAGQHHPDFNVLEDPTKGDAAKYEVLMDKFRGAPDQILVLSAVLMGAMAGGAIVDAGLDTRKLSSIATGARAAMMALEVPIQAAKLLGVEPEIGQMAEQLSIQLEDQFPQI